MTQAVLFAKRAIAWPLCIAIALSILSGPALAQGSAGQISGTIHDEQSGVLPGVSMTVKNQVTGVSRTIVSDESGRYVFAALPSGPLHASRRALRLRHPGSRGHRHHHRPRVPPGPDDEGAGAGRERDDSRRVADRRRHEGRNLRHGHARADRDAAAQLAPVSVARAARPRHDGRRDAVVLRHGQRRRVDDVQRHRQRRRRHDQQLGGRRRAAAGSAGGCRRRSSRSPTPATRRSSDWRPAAWCRSSPSRARTTTAARHSSTSATSR